MPTKKISESCKLCLKMPAEPVLSHNRVVVTDWTTSIPGF